MNLSFLNNPPSEYRGAPLWVWNGKLEKKELIRQIHIMKEMGFGGFFMHSRTGLQTEYLGAEWLELIRECAEEASRLNMRAYLYDEDRWPSGSCGGLATKNPRYRMKFMTADIMAADSFDLKNYGQEFLASFAVKFNENLISDYYPVTDKIEIKNAYSAVVFKVEEMPKYDFYNGFTYLDTLNIEATQVFIKETHEKYKAACGDMFGKELIGIFTDEPHRGNTFGRATVVEQNRCPYTYKLFETFKSMAGYDLRDKLPELFFVSEKGGFSSVSYHYVNVLQQMFLDNFAKPYSEWCANNKLVFTGHILHEDSLSNQTVMSGSVMRFYEYMDYPGIDILTESNCCYWTVKQCASVAKQLGKPFVLSELYGCTGWQTGLEQYKWMGDWQAVLGVNLRCHHLLWYTMEGESKRDFPASIFFQCGWYKQFSYVENYFSRLNFALSAGEPITDILVVSPIESVWGYVHKGCFKGIHANAPEIKKLENGYVNQFNALTKECADFDYADEEMMSRYCHVKDGKLYVGKMGYKTVLISGLDTLRASTLEILNNFAVQGGTVVFCGIPEYVDGVKKVFDTSGFTEVSSDEAAAKLCAGLSDIRLETDVSGLLYQIRRDGCSYIVVLINTDREKAIGKAEIKINVSLNAEEYDLRRGEKTPCLFKHSDEGITIFTDFEKGQERMFLLSQDRPSILSSTEKMYNTTEIPLKLRYKLNEPNFLVLDIADYYIDGKYIEKNEILKIDRSIRSQYGLSLRGGGMMQPWYKNKYCPSAEKNICKLKLVYKFFIDKMPENIDFACEAPHRFDIAINGNTVNTQPDGTILDKSLFVINIPISCFNTGENIIETQCDFSDGVNLEPVYILGNFGVNIDGTKLTVTGLPEMIDARPLSEQGLPFYSGGITLYTGVKSGNVSIEFKRIRGACVEADFGCEKEIICFSPYISKFHKIQDELKFTLYPTRRNLFGPLHLVNPIQPHYAPETFVTENEHFTLNYSLIDEGIDIPIIKCRND